MKKIILSLNLIIFMCLDVKANLRMNYFFAHGIADSHKQAYRFTPQSIDGKPNKHFIIQDRLFTFDFPDATQHFWRVNFTKTSLGQANEILTMYKAYNNSIALLKEEPTPHLITLIGLSRGASTTINFMGLFNPKEVKALVLESPFDTTSNLIASHLKRNSLHSVPGLQGLSESLMSLVFMQHDKNGLKPLDMVRRIRKDLPILLICSKEDATIPFTNTVNLYNKLKNTGHEHAYLLILDKGRHAELLAGSQGHIYEKVAHAFFAKYGLLHNPLLAQEGSHLLDLCQSH